MSWTHAAITGTGATAYTKASGRSVLSLADEAARAAIADAGLQPSDIDGIASFMVMHDSVPTVALATSLALPGLRWQFDLDLGGQSPCHLVAQAAAAIATGQARHVLVFRAMNGRSGPRVGTMQFHGGGAAYRYPIGYDAYLMYVAMWGQRFLHETGQGPEDLGAVAVAQREHAQRNPAAARRQPLTLDEYLAMPYVVEPYRAPDCTIEVDGACAVVVSALDAARDLRHPPAVVASGGYRAGPRPGLDIGDHLLWDDMTRNYTSHLRDELFGRAGVTRTEAVSLARFRLAAGASTGSSRYLGCDEFFVVLSGTGVATLSEVETPVRAGSVVAIARGEPHALRADAGGPLEFLAVLAPAFDPARYEPEG